MRLEITAQQVSKAEGVSAAGKTTPFQMTSRRALLHSADHVAAAALSYPTVPALAAPISFAAAVGVRRSVHGHLATRFNRVATTQGGALFRAVHALLSSASPSWLRFLDQDELVALESAASLLARYGMGIGEIPSKVLDKAGTIKERTELHCNPGGPYGLTSNFVWAA